VTEHHGKRTPGVDRGTWKTPAQKATALGRLRQRGYRPQPWRRVDVANPHGQLSGLGIHPLRDRAMQALSLLALDPMAEMRAAPHSDGCRPQRAPADAIEQGLTVLAKKASPQGVFEGDRRTCLDELSPNWLLAHIPMDTASLPTWLQAGDSAGHVLQPTAAGTPHGGICSPGIANLALDGLEARLRTAFPRDVWNGHTQVCPTVNGIRLADDFVITGATKALLEDAVKPRGEAFVKARGLHRSPEKTVITHMADGFDLLGQHIHTYPGKLLIKPSAKSIKRVLLAPDLPQTSSSRPGFNAYAAPCHTGVWKGLSRISGH